MPEAHLKALNHALWTMSRQTFGNWVPDASIQQDFDCENNLLEATPVVLDDVRLLRFVTFDLQSE